jgi:hypothetical protein
MAMPCELNLITLIIVIAPLTPCQTFSCLCLHCSCHYTHHVCHVCCIHPSHCYLWYCPYQSQCTIYLHLSQTLPSINPKLFIIMNPIQLCLLTRNHAYHFDPIVIILMVESNIVVDKGPHFLMCTQVLWQHHPILYFLPSFLPCKITFMDDCDGI